MKIQSILYISHKQHYITPAGLAVTGGFPWIIREFSKHCDRLILCVPVKEQNHTTIAVTEYPKNVEVVPLDAYRSRVGFIKNIWRNIRKIARVCVPGQMAYIPLPNSMGIIGLIAVRLSKGKPVLHFGTDRADQARARSNSRVVGAFKNLVIRFFIYTLIKMLMRNAPAFFVGSFFMGYQPSWQMIFMTSFSENDMSQISRRELQPGRVIFLGRLDKPKRVEDAIEAVYELGKDGLLVDFAVYGAGPEREKIESLGKSRLGDRFQISDPVTKDALINDIFPSASVLVLPSSSEAQGKVLLEAMARKVPVVATSVGGIPNVVKDEVTGLLVNPCCPSELASAIRRVLTDKKLRMELTENGYEIAKERTLERTVSQVVETAYLHYRLS